jgi:hypothetical protein
MVEWITSDAPVPYPTAVAEMEARVAGSRPARRRRRSGCWSIPPLYTAGTSADPGDLKDPDRFPVFETGAAGSTPITAPASAWPMPCSTSTPAAATCAPMWSGWRPGSSPRWRSST